METDVNTLTTRDVSSASSVETRGNYGALITFGLVSLVVLVTVIGYWPVMFDFFLGDDFVHLTWLKDAVKNPELIWRNFHSSWLDGTTTRFYRPLISVFMVTDYLGWGINGLGYHITNLLFHLTATVFIFFCARFFLQDTFGWVGKNVLGNTALGANGNLSYGTASTGESAGAAGFGANGSASSFETAADEVDDDDDNEEHGETETSSPGRRKTKKQLRREAKEKAKAAAEAEARERARRAKPELEPLGVPWNIAFLLYPLGAALIFGLYPLHTEAVSWITGRVDAVVTAFYTATFYFYIRWRKDGGKAWLTASMISFALGLLSKEMALTLPPAFMLYEALLGPNAILRDGRKNFAPPVLLKWAMDVVKPVLIFWGMVVVYFGVRRYALGTFVGGYDDSLFFIADIKHFLLSWLHGLRMFLIPLNKGLMNSHHFVTRCWEVSLVATFLMMFVNIVMERRLFRLWLFNVIFMFFCFAPVYKIFTIADDLQGARLAHVATVALALLMAMAFIVPTRNPFKKKTESKNVVPKLAPPIGFGLRLLVCIGFSATCGAALWINNQAWATAGNEANAIRAGLHKLYEQIKDDPQVLLLSLPDQINGAYISRNAVYGMTKAPQLQRDIWNALSVNKYEQILPFGYIKDSLWDARDKVLVYSWNSKQGKFIPLKMERDPDDARNWIGVEMKSIATVKQGEFRWHKDGYLIVYGDNTNAGRPEVVLNFDKRNSFDIEFVAVKIRDLDTTGASAANLATEGADLLYTNDVSPEFDLPNRTHSDFIPGLKEQTLIFPLRSLPEWSLGGHSHELLLKLPHNSKIAIDEIEIVKPEKLMPKLSFENSGFLGTKGYLHLSNKDNRATLKVDATKVPSAAGVEVEITRTNLLFETQNSFTPSKVTMKEILKGTVSGDIELKRDMFPATGMYELRAWAVDKDGKRIGVAGDHICVSIDN